MSARRAGFVVYKGVPGRGFSGELHRNGSIAAQSGLGFVWNFPRRAVTIGSLRAGDRSRCLLGSGPGAPTEGQIEAQLTDLAITTEVSV